jgi:hypothetical protein
VYFKTTQQKGEALCNRFYRLDVVFIEARETRDTFISITVKLRPGITDGHSILEYVSGLYTD